MSCIVGVFVDVNDTIETELPKKCIMLENEETCNKISYANC